MDGQSARSLTADHLQAPRQLTSASTPASGSVSAIIGVAHPVFGTTILRPYRQDTKLGGHHEWGAQQDEIAFSGDEGDEESLPVEVARGERRVYSEKSDPTIHGLYRSYQRGQLALQPEFQRGYVWDDAKASRLIESVLLDVPIPNFYLAEEQDASKSVIDGQQRLTSFFRAFQPVPLSDGKEAPKLRLRGLRVLTDLNDQAFEEWGGTFQEKFENSGMRVVTILKESNPDVKYEIFERLNTRSMGLNDQELRNCVYRGAYNALLHDLSDDGGYQSVLGWKQRDKRMRDVELILRFFAFQRATYLNYRSPMKAFLNREMEDHRELGQKEMMELRTKFKDAVALTKTVFGGTAFRRFVPGSDKNPNGGWERPLNKALFDVVMFGFTQYSKHQMMPHCDAIREELIWLMSNDQEFVAALMISTNGVPRVRARFEKWLASLREIVGEYHEETRTFRAADKEALYARPGGETCAWEKCGQKIMTIDDAEVDHIEHYWRGGKTDLANARLLHRSCNRRRGGGD